MVDLGLCTWDREGPGVADLEQQDPIGHPRGGMPPTATGGGGSLCRQPPRQALEGLDPSWQGCSSGLAVALISCS